MDISFQLIKVNSGSYNKESACNVWETWVQYLGWEDALEKEVAAHSSILAWRILWTKSLTGHSPWHHKESDTTELLTTQASMMFNFLISQLSVKKKKNHNYL